MNGGRCLIMNEQQTEEGFSRIELRLEQEKLKLEHERIALERERLDAARERMNDASDVQVTRDGQVSVRLSTVALSSIICLLVGGILGAVSTSVQHDRRGAARLKEALQALNIVEAEQVPAEPLPAIGPTNVVAAVEFPSVFQSRPMRVRTIRGKGDSGVSLIVVQ
jgi:hypothetical protein